VTYAIEPLRDGQVLDVGNVKIQVLHTPGHTPDSICLLVTDHRRGDAPWFVVTGDTLFVGSIGRPDLAGKEREMAGVLYDSVHAKLLMLPDDLEIFPGHQAGSACGAGLSGKPSSTLGFEKRWNPALSMDRAGFVNYLTQNIPPPPADMAVMMIANRGLAC
jgi:glyoxylase-like metal-dependent hydrolase (beta-lactamase superfamily II)